MESNGRLMSLDVLRGFDMFFITGGASLIVALCGVCGAGDGWLARQMGHVPWNGLAHHDTIFPLFLFLAGVSWPFSLASQRLRGRTTFQIVRKIFVRSCTLFLLGLSFGGILAFEPHFRIPSVLGHIGLSWGLAALIWLFSKRLRTRFVWIAVLLSAYWALLRFVPAPDAAAGVSSYAKMGNVISWLDRTLMPNHIYARGVYDPESLFSVFNGVAMALIGMCAGALLRSPACAPRGRALGLASGAGVLFALAFFFHFVLGDAVVKALWTTSFVLFTAAYSMSLLALFYWVIDVRGWRRGASYFQVIGMNSITIYLLQMYAVLQPLHKRFFGAASAWISPPWGDVFGSATYCLTVWLVLGFLYRRKIFLKI